VVDIKNIIMRNITSIDNSIEEGLRLAWEVGTEPALHLLNSLLQNESCHARLQHALGLIYSNYSGNRMKAEQHFRRAIQLDPMFIYSYWHLIKLLEDEERYNDALEIYQSVKGKK
jgi:tetratricopeptide (TPR) repeat protein